ncbi:MAG: hypothetical protein IK105_00555 [Thermoguttaceae bacterium]|nr:hypothetical protein [Thermoguttaceae bacterium]
MKPIVRIAVLFCLGFFFCPAPHTLFSAEDEKEALIKSLIDAREDWIQNASFCGNYTIKNGHFSTEEEAMTAEIPDGERVEHGFIAKLNDRFRYRFSSGTENGGRFTAKAVSDTVANKRFCLSVDHIIGEKDPSPYNGNLIEYPGDIEENLAAGWGFATPMYYFSSAVYKFIKSAAEGSDFEYADQEDGRVLLTFTEERPNGHKRVEEVTVRTDLNRPVIEQFSLTNYTDKPDLTMKIVSKVLEWKDCGGFLLPMRHRVMIHPYKPFPGTEPWETVECSSDDLGGRPPRKKDFAVKLKYGDFILHLKKPWWKRTIHIDSLTDRNYDPEVPDFFKDPQQLQQFLTRKKRPHAEGFYLRLGGAAAGLALIALALVLKYRKGRKRAAA